MVPQVLTAWSTSRSCVLMIYFKPSTCFKYWWKKFQSEPHFRAQHSVTKFVNWHSAHIFVICTRDLEKLFVSRCRENPIMRAVAYWFHLRLWFSPIIPGWRFMQNVVVFSFVSMSSSTAFLLWYPVSRLPCSGAQFTTFMCSGVPRTLLSRVFCFPCR